MSQWIYLTDMAPQATIINPESGELRQIMSSAVKDRAPTGLRRFTLEELPGGTYRETGDMLPLTGPLYDDLVECYNAPNSWNFDWPHWQTEQVADDDVAMRDRVMSRLSTMMQQHPYDFQITGLQRRFLMYYSDGDLHSQQRFERFIPLPKTSPFRSDGTLQRRYDFLYNSIMRDAGVPVPKEKLTVLGGGTLRPCLYIGAAWVVRFTIDGHDPLLDRCRVYVDDDAGFICSDWCQRHDYSSYSNGINLQTGIYSFDGWVTGPCIIRNAEQGWRPKSAEVKRVAVRELLKSAPPPVPTFDAVLTKAKAAVEKYAKAHTPTPPAVDAGPITADVMAEAIAAAEAVWASKVAATEVSPPEDPAPTRSVTRIGNWQVVDFAVQYKHADFTKGYRIAFNDRDFQNADGETYVAASLLTDWMGSVEDAPDPIELVDIDNDGCGFAWRDDMAWYVNSTGATIGEEPLNDHWWMWHAAQHYKTHLSRTAIEAMLLSELCT